MSKINELLGAKNESWAQEGIITLVAQRRRLRYHNDFDGVFWLAVLEYIPNLTERGDPIAHLIWRGNCAIKSFIRKQSKINDREGIELREDDAIAPIEIPITNNGEIHGQLRLLVSGRLRSLYDYLTGGDISPCINSCDQVCKGMIPLGCDYYAEAISKELKVEKRTFYVYRQRLVSKIRSTLQSRQNESTVQVSRGVSSRPRMGRDPTLRQLANNLKWWEEVQGPAQ